MKIIETKNKNTSEKNKGKRKQNEKRQKNGLNSVNILNRYC